MPCVSSKMTVIDGYAMAFGKSRDEKLAEWNGILYGPNPTKEYSSMVCEFISRVDEFSANPTNFGIFLMLIENMMCLWGMWCDTQGNRISLSSFMNNPGDHILNLMEKRLNDWKALYAKSDTYNSILKYIDTFINRLRK